MASWGWGEPGKQYSILLLSRHDPTHSVLPIVVVVVIIASSDSRSGSCAGPIKHAPIPILNLHSIRHPRSSPSLRSSSPSSSLVSSDYHFIREDVGHLPEAGGARAAGAQQSARQHRQAQEPRRDPPRLPRRPPLRRLLHLLRRRRRPRLRCRAATQPRRRRIPEDVLRAGRHLLRVHGDAGQPEQPDAAVRPHRPLHQRGAAGDRGLPHPARPGPLPGGPGGEGPLRLLRLRRVRQPRPVRVRGRRVRGAEHGRRGAAALGRGGGRVGGDLRRPRRGQGRVRAVVRAVPAGVHVPQRGRAQELRAPHEPAQGAPARGQRGRHVRRQLQGRRLHQDQLHAPRRQRHQLGRHMGRRRHLISSARPATLAGLLNEFGLAAFYSFSCLMYILI